MIELKGLPKLRKLSVLRGLPDLEGRRRKPALPELPGVTEESDTLSPAEERRREIARLVGDDGLAHRVMKLQREHPQGTVPELVAMDWLQREGIAFYYQTELFGGRRGGGLVPDFLVQTGANSDAWMIQGEYWHSRDGKEEADAADYLRLRGTDFGTGRIQNVLQLWDSAIYRNRPDVFWAAMAGVEMGR